MPFGIQPWHIVVIVLVALVIFGPAKLPELGRSIGKTINEFRSGAKEMTDSLKDEMSKGSETGQNNYPPVYKEEGPQTIYKSPEPPQKPDSTVFCTQCGAQNPGDARFCKNCGKPIVS